MDFRTVAPVLQAVGMAEAEDGPLDRTAIATDLELSLGELGHCLTELETYGLILSGDFTGSSPMLLDAGRQYLALRGRVDADSLAFLPGTIDDLHARDALLRAGSILVDEFRASLIAGRAVDHARDLVPPAFAVAVDEKIGLDLFAATVALMVRLSVGEPAGCVAEEVIAVSLIDQATMWLAMQADTGAITEDAAELATERLPGLFDLFQDDDVLRLFEMVEPSDAAVDGGSPSARRLGVADQRIESWFTPFGGVAPTGYLHE